jgi:hypothetical protein
MQPPEREREAPVAWWFSSLAYAASVYAFIVNGAAAKKRPRWRVDEM